MIVSMPEPILIVRDVRKQFGSFEALRGASFEVFEGELFGLLGPNGAGKTTLLSILSCLSDASSGEAILIGQKLAKGNRDIRRLIGIGTQELSLYGELTARENLFFFGRLYAIPEADLPKRADEILERIGLLDRANDRAGTFSGGMKRRLNLGIALIHRPKILFLDEPTTGVDPQSRNHIFEHVRELNRKGMTVIYTSHYMEEVETLCPRMAILDHGQVIACDTLKGLLKRLDGVIRLTLAADAGEVADHMRQLSGVREVAVEESRYVVRTNDVAKSLIEIVRLLSARNIDLVELHTEEPNLEKVFLHLTERTLRD